MDKKTYTQFAIALLLIILAVGLYAVFRPANQELDQALVTNFEECVAAGNPVMESFPEQCATSDGRTFTRVLTPEEEALLNPPPLSSPTTPSNPGTGGGVEQPVSQAPCYVGGCSGQVCSDDRDGAITTCEYRPEYACYRTAKCERQRSGQCGWTETPALRSCLQNPPAL